MSMSNLQAEPFDFVDVVELIAILSRSVDRDDEAHGTLISILWSQRKSGHWKKMKDVLRDKFDFSAYGDSAKLTNIARDAFDKGILYICEIK